MNQGHFYRESVSNTHVKYVFLYINLKFATYLSVDRVGVVHVQHNLNIIPELHLVYFKSIIVHYLPHTIILFSQMK